MIRNDLQLSVNTKSMTPRQLRLAALQAKNEKLQEVPLWQFPELYVLATIIRAHKLAKEMSQEMRLKYSVQHCLRFLREAEEEKHNDSSCED